METKLIPFQHQLIFLTNCDISKNSILNELSSTNTLKITFLTDSFVKDLKLPQAYCNLQSLDELEKLTQGIECIVFQSKESSYRDSNGIIELTDHDLILIDKLIHAYKKNHVQRLLWINQIPEDHKKTTPYYKSDLDLANIFKNAGVRVTQLRSHESTTPESILMAIQYSLQNLYTLDHIYNIQNPNLFTKNVCYKFKKNSFFNNLKNKITKTHFNSIDRIQFPDGYHADSIIFSFIHWLCDFPRFILQVEKKKNTIFISIPLVKMPLLILEHNYLTSTQNYQTFKILGGFLVKNQSGAQMEFREVIGQNILLISVSNLETKIPWHLHKLIQIPIQYFIIHLFQNWLLNIKNKTKASASRRWV